MSNIQVKEANSLVKEYYTSYAKYVLETRALPSIYDGMKFAQRRLVFVASRQTPNKLIKSANLLGSTIPYHPHSLDSLYGTLVGMTTPTVNFRLFRGKGNFGGSTFGPAAYRYTEAFLEDYARFCYTQFIDDADYIQGESGLDEPFALPALVPYSNIIGSSGIGVGLSTNILPLNIMELIDYYIDTIKGNKPKTPTPDFGNFIIDMDDNDIDTNVEAIDSVIRIKPVVVQESSNTLVIEGLYNKNISNILDKIGDLLDSGKVDFRDESTDKTRYVFEIYDNSVSISELSDTLTHYSSSRMTFCRLVVDKDKAIYSSLKHQVSKSLEYLNHVLDSKFANELKRLKFSENVLLAIEYIKSTGLINRLGQLSSDELKDYIIKNGNFDKDVVNAAVSKPITYLTKSHLNELKDIQNRIVTNQNTDRTTYLIDLYEKFKQLIKPYYDSESHSIRKSQLLTNPKIKKFSNNSVLISNSGLKFKDSFVIITKSGILIPSKVLSTTRKVIEFNNIDDIVDIATDYTTDIIVLITNKSGIIANNYDDIKYEKKVINMDDDEYVKSVIRVKTNNNDSIFNYCKIDYDANRFIRHKISKPIRNWTV